MVGVKGNTMLLPNVDGTSPDVECRHIGFVGDASITGQDPRVSSLRSFLREELSLRCHAHGGGLKAPLNGNSLYIILVGPLRGAFCQLETYRRQMTT